MPTLNTCLPRTLLASQAFGSELGAPSKARGYDDCSCAHGRTDKLTQTPRLNSGISPKTANSNYLSSDLNQNTFSALVDSKTNATGA